MLKQLQLNEAKYFHSIKTSFKKKKNKNPPSAVMQKQQGPRGPNKNDNLFWRKDF